MACLAHGEWNLRSRSPIRQIILMELGLALDALWHALPMGNGTWDIGVLSSNYPLGTRSCPGCFMACLNHGELNLRSCSHSVSFRLLPVFASTGYGIFAGIRTLPPPLGYLHCFTVCNILASRLFQFSKIARLRENSVSAYTSANCLHSLSL